MKVLLLSGCSLVWPGVSTAAQDLSTPEGQPGPNCQGVISPLVRLACYERWARHEQPQPEADKPAYRLWSDAATPFTPMTKPMRASNRSAFTLTTVPDRITLNQYSHDATLIISCQQRITHLAIQLERPWPSATPGPELWLDEIPQSARWFIRQQGRTLESGRGLPAIAQLKNWLTTQRLRIPLPQGQEVQFDLRGLSDAIEPLRRECHW